MTFREVLRMRLGIGALLLSLILFGGISLAAEGRETVAGLPAAEALRLGEIMYGKGLLPSGKPMMAIVQGGIEMEGTMSSCANCHLPSGLGSLEGGVVSPPTNGVKLYAPLKGQKDLPGSTMKRSMFYSPARPAYTDQSLARMLVTGVDPAGRTLNEIMPRYILDEKEMEIMVYYLKNLSSKFSPGLTQDEIRFAVVIGEGVSAAQRDALLKPLQAYVREEWNRRLPQMTAQWNALWRQSYMAGDGNAFRKIVLDIWELKGSPDTWGGQLEEYYRQKPVFALLGGITGGSWAPVHAFSEKNKIPCVLPITDLPVISESDRYTLYISKGLYQEGDAAAKFLSRVFALPADKKVVQVFRENDRGRALAGGFTAAWEKLGNVPLVDRVVPAGGKINNDFWKKLSAAYPGAVLLLWLDPTDLAGVGTLADSANRPLFFSGSMLAGALTAVPDAVRDYAFIAYPFRLPEDSEYPRSLFESWMKHKKLPVTDQKVAAHAVMLKNILTDVLVNTAGEYYREFFLDNLDQEKDQLYSSLTYPILSFGPGQRYAAKGCYVVTITRGDKPKVVKQSDWVIY